MKPLLQKMLSASLAVGLSLLASMDVVAQDDSGGFVRITKPKTSQVVDQQVTPAGFRHATRHQVIGQDCDCQNETYDCWGDGTACRKHGLGNLWCKSGHCHGLYYHDCTGEDMCNYFRCKFGYFIPSGAGGAGVPWVGKYSRVYPQDPYYFDGRDGQAWAAQGYGVPMAVPLAPVVGHTYNYGWGIPSSRLTPVSRPTY